MAFKKGQKAGPGRPKGMENKLTTEAREMFIQTLEGQVPNIQQAFSDVLDKSPEKYLDLFAKYAQYFVPKKTETDVKVSEGQSIDINETMRRLRGED
jgi:hypothetical protein